MKTSTVLLVVGLGVAGFLFLRPPKIVAVPVEPVDPLRQTGANLAGELGSALIGAIFGGGKTEPVKPAGSAPAGGGGGSTGPLDFGGFTL
jgi:hypothetical protein